MDTTMIDKTEITTQLRNMTAEVLFGAKPWPIDDNAAVHQQLLDWGLIEELEITIGTSAEFVERPKSSDSKKDEICFRITELGSELSVNYWTLFMGHHELSEIPDLLVEYGLLTQEEANHTIFDRWERDERLEDILPPILRRLYRAQSR